MVDILMIIKTNNINNDYRLQKECISLKKSNQKIKILALEEDNINRKGLSDYNIPYRCISIKTRKVFPRAKFLFIKSIEMYSKFIFYILIYKPRIVWLHEMYMFGLVSFVHFFKKIGYIKILIWDQHELPGDRFLKNKFLKKKLIKKMNLPIKLISANKERAEYLEKILNIKKEKFTIIENYVDKEFLNYKSTGLPSKLNEWLNNTPYIVSLSATLNPKRYFKELIEAIMRVENIKLIVIGSFNEKQINEIANNYDYNKFLKKCYFTGYVNQFELKKYLHNAIASAMFYSHDIMNNKLCAPNRIYQAISCGTPVLVGSNPPMSRLVKKHNCGVIINGDGNNPDEIQKGIELALKNYTILKSNTNKAKSFYLWENQEKTINDLITV